MSSIAWLALMRRSVVIREHCRSSRSVLRKSSRAQRAQLQPVSSIIVRHWQPVLKPYRSRNRPGRVRCAVQLHRLAVLADALQRPVPLQPCIADVRISWCARICVCTQAGQGVPFCPSQLFESMQKAERKAATARAAVHATQKCSSSRRTERSQAAATES